MGVLPSPRGFVVLICFALARALAFLRHGCGAQLNSAPVPESSATRDKGRLVMPSPATFRSTAAERRSSSTSASPRGGTLQETESESLSEYAHRVGQAMRCSPSDCPDVALPCARNILILKADAAMALAHLCRVRGLGILSCHRQGQRRTARGPILHMTLCALTNPTPRWASSSGAWALSRSRTIRFSASHCRPLGRYPSRGHV